MDQPYTPSKPRLYTNHTDRLPLAHRPGAMDAPQLPSRYGDKLVWPDGSTAPVEAPREQVQR